MMDSNGEKDDLVLLTQKHAKFFQRSLAVLPSSLASYDSQRVTIAFFSISGLDLLDKISLVSDQTESMIEWLYSCLMISEKPETEHWSGFRGSTALRISDSTGPGHAH